MPPLQRPLNPACPAPLERSPSSRACTPTSSPPPSKSSRTFVGLTPLASLTHPTDAVAVVYASSSTRHAPPRALHAILLTSRALYARLAPSACPRLYARLFDIQFDARAPADRLADAWGLRAMDSTHELCRRFDAFRIFRRGALDDPRLDDALVIAWLMMLEDEGSNSEHLRRAGLPALLLDFLRLRHRQCLSPQRTWPVEDRRSALVLALFWALTSEGMVTLDVPE